MNSHRLRFAALLAFAPLASSSSSGDFDLLQVSNGFGLLLPHKIIDLDSVGNPPGTVIEVRQLEDLIQNISPSNGVMPTRQWPLSPTLPSGWLGNHFLAVSFSQPLQIASILTNSPSGAATSQLTGTIVITAHDPITGQTELVQGRAFVGGLTYSAPNPGGPPPPQLFLQRWFSNQSGVLVANPSIDNNMDSVADGLGVPGTEAGTQPFGADLLARNNVFLFIPDSDNDLTTHETFPTDRQIEIRVSTGVMSLSGEQLCRQARVSSTVGPLDLPPEIQFIPPPLSTPSIVPGNGETDVDPMTDIIMNFTESIQLSSLGTLTGAGPATISDAITLSYGPQQNPPILMPFTVLPVSVYDLATVRLIPDYPFPGEGATGGAASCGPLNQIDVAVHADEVTDLDGSTNLLAANTFFTTGEGPGLTNAPVAPDAIYAGLGGSSGALSVIDLNGFGAGTGNPTYDPFNPITESNSNYPNNPNLKFQGALLRPPLSQGNCSTDGGSEGVFTRTLDSNLDHQLARSPYLMDVSDLALGQALDTSFNNAPAPFGCQAGSANLCASSGLKQVFVTNSGTGNTTQPAGPGDTVTNMGIGTQNTISWAPHPNPPPLSFPPLCISPNIGGQEPTSVVSSLAPPAGQGLVNLLVPGDALGDADLGIPPSGLLSPEQSAFFQGPSPTNSSLANCQPYMLRQQIGQFLYVVDRERRELVVLNSNRMTPIDRISLPDPTRLAMSPNLDYLAVTNQSAGTVSFIDTAPSSGTFHEVVQETAVGHAPLGIAWDSLNEDILVCNERSNDVSVISAFTLSVRKIVSLPSLSRPFEVVITPRQTNFGSLRNVYYGYVLSRDGAVSIFESGPDGVNGWGYDDLIGKARYKFRRPKAIAIDVSDLNSGVWIAHEGMIDLQTGQSAPPGTGALTRIFAQTNTLGQIPLGPGNTVPQFRQLRIKADISLGSSVLTGIPTDLAFDNLRNLGALQNFATAFSAGVPAQFNGKSLVRAGGPATQAASSPMYLFAAIPTSTDNIGGAVDVIKLASLQRQDTNSFQPGVQSIEMDGVMVLADYFRQ